MEAPGLSDISVPSKLILPKVKRLKKTIKKAPHVESNTFECLVCENMYESILKLRIHVISDHNGRKVVGKLPFMCKKCGLLYRKRSYLNQHYLKKHPTVHFKGKPQLSYVPVLVEVQKEVVETITKDVADFVKVQRTFVEQRYRCDLCSVICKNKAAVRHHKLSKHTEQTDWKCLLCNYITKFKQYYIRHVANKHPETNEIVNRSIHVCKVCGYSTHVKGHFQAHSQTHLENKNYMCEICGRRTKTKNAMISHRRMHLKDKKYSCGVDSCQFKTVHLTSLKHHRLSHDPEKNTLHCDKCNFKTFNKYTMNSHVQQHKTGEKIFKCSLCVFETAQNVNLKHHMHKHGKEMKFMCNLCNFTYKYENSLRKHMKKHSSEEQKDTDNNLKNLDTKISSKNSMKYLNQNDNTGISSRTLIIEKDGDLKKKTMCDDMIKIDINKKYCFNAVVGDTFQGNYNANRNIINPILQYNDHDNQQHPTEHKNNITNYENHSNHSDNHSNSIVQCNVGQKQNVSHVTSAIITNEGCSLNRVVNHDSFSQYDAHSIHPTDNDGHEKYYINNVQSNSNSSSRYNITQLISNETGSGGIPVNNCPQFKNHDCCIQYNDNDKSNLSYTETHINNNQSYYNQIENHNTAITYDVAEKRGSNEIRNNEVINKKCTNKIEKSFIQYKNGLNCVNNHSNSFIQYNANHNNSVTEIESNSFSQNYNTGKIRILNQTINHSGSFVNSRNDNLSKHCEIDKKQNSTQIQNSNNSFISYNSNNKGAEIELRNNTNNSFIQHNDKLHFNEVKHNNSPLSDYAKRYNNNLNKEQLHEPRNHRDSANAIEIVMNKGVLMMSVDCDAFRSYQDFDYFQD